MITFAGSATGDCVLFIKIDTVGCVFLPLLNLHSGERKEGRGERREEENYL